MSKRVIPMAPPAAAPDGRPKMPVDRFAMMRQVNLEASHFDTVSAGQNHRERKELETKRRAEVTLMEREDYTFTAEGVDRLRRREARLLMEVEEKCTRQVLAAEAAARYEALERERKRAEAEERQRLLEVHRAQMEAQKVAEAAALERKLAERDARLKKMKEDADRKVREEYQKKEEAKRAEIARVRQLQQQQTERVLMEAEEEAERDRLHKEAEARAIQEKIRAEELKWKAWEEAEAKREAEALAARRALLAAQYEEDKARRMDLHRVRKEKESRLKKMAEPVQPTPEPPIAATEASNGATAEATATVRVVGIPKAGSFVIKPAPDKLDLKDVASMNKDQLRDELATCSALKKQLKQDITTWCDSFQAKTNRPPSLEEKQEIQPLYKRYSEIESHYRAVRKRLEGGDAKPALAPVAEAPPVKATTTKLPPTSDAPSIQVILMNRKRDVKKAIQDWTTAFQATHGHPPSVQDKKEILALYEDYAKIDAQLKNLKIPVATADAPAVHKKATKATALDMNAIRDMAAKQAARTPTNQADAVVAAPVATSKPSATEEVEKSDEPGAIDALVPVEPAEEPLPTAGADASEAKEAKRAKEEARATAITNQEAPSNISDDRREPTTGLKVTPEVSATALDQMPAPGDSKATTLEAIPAPLPEEAPSVELPSESVELSTEETRSPTEADLPKPSIAEIPEPPTAESSESLANELTITETTLPPPEGTATPAAEVEPEVHTLLEWIQLELDLLDSLDDAPAAEAPTLNARFATVVAALHRALEDAPPFLRVDAVEGASPAAVAGMAPGDLIVRFGSVVVAPDRAAGALIRDVVALVNGRAKAARAVGISVRRDGDDTRHLVLRPQKWAGNGLLGCVLQPYDAAKAPSPPKVAPPPEVPVPPAYDMAPLEPLLHPPEGLTLAAAVDWEMQLWDTREDVVAWLAQHPLAHESLTAVAAQIDAVLAELVAVIRMHVTNTAWPYLKVETVEAASPAATAGLEAGDLIVRFGAIISTGDTPASSLIQHIVALVGHRRDRMLSLTVVRNGLLLHFALRPQKWAGSGYLGCVLQPYEPPPRTPEPVEWPPNAFAYIDTMAPGPSAANMSGVVEHDFIVGFEGLAPDTPLPRALASFNTLTTFPLTLYLCRYLPRVGDDEDLGYVEFAVTLESWDGILSIQPLVAPEAIEDVPPPEETPLPSVPFARVERVYADSPADYGGLMVGDYVYAITDVVFPSPEAVSDWIGTQYTQIELRITPERWCNRQLQLSAQERRMIELFGWQLAFLQEPVYPPFLVVLNVAAPSPAAVAGMRAGDLVGKFGQLLKAALPAAVTVADVVALYLGPEAKLHEGRKVAPLPLQLHRYNPDGAALEQINVALPPPPTPWVGPGVWGMELGLWAPESLAPLLVVTDSRGNGLCEGDIVLQLNDVLAPSAVEVVQAAVAGAATLALVVQRWEPVQYAYLYFPLVVDVAPPMAPPATDEVTVAGATCIPYDVYWQRYEASHPSALPCKDCWEANFATVAHGAAYCGHLDCLTYLSEYFDVYCVDPLGRTPLFYAAYANQVDCILLLLSLDEKATLRETTDGNGDTILHAATSGGALEAMRLLLQHGLSPERVNSLGLRPVHIAPTMEALQVLAEGQADMLALDSSGRLALTYACMAGDEACVTFLATEGPEFVDYPDADGNTPLHHAVISGSLACAEAIVKQAAGGYMLRTNKEGKTALDHARDLQLGPLIQFLERTCSVGYSSAESQ
ncbi:hypothetical protein ACHHYP_13691 [Achlya hypogyna]|uniref:PDZ domain-containing protein n=1 Tax=Achlya hypogyna TaxID=1202772 RepID=A0A1V9YEP6_ACHHY|nr:hypothetical protein ACHHYP_13691 [Achlya hypogyna]